MNLAYSEPRYANFIRSIFMSQKVLEDVGIKTFPVSLRPILRYYKVTMLSYEKFCSENNRTIEECFEAFGPDAATVETSEGYIIVFNKEATPPERRQFTIAHEIGHIVLRHHKELGTDTIRRMWVEKSLYDIMEDEANCFARNLLSPPVASMELLRTNGFTEMKYDEGQKRYIYERLEPINDYMKDFTFLQRAFMITPKAAKTRCHFLKDDLVNLRPQQKKNPPKIEFTSKWRCAICGAERVDGKTICYFCGSKGRFKYLLEEDVPAPLISLPYDGSHYKRCFFCGNTSFDRDSLFCSVCGKAASNPCVPFLYPSTNIPSAMKTAHHFCPPNARYCPDCGEMTLYTRLHYKLPDEGAPEMNYGPTIPHVEFSKRIIKCPKCLYDEHAEEAMFCIMCGTSLYNSCSNRHPNSPNARYCSQCGEPTDFLKSSILRPYQSVLKENLSEVKIEVEELGLSVEDFIDQLNENTSSN